MSRSLRGYLHRASLGQKFLAAFSAIMIVLLASLAAIVVYLTRINSYVERHNRITVPALVTVGKMREDAFQIALMAQRVVGLGPGAAQIGQLQNITGPRQRIAADLSRYRQTHAVPAHPVLHEMLERHGRMDLVQQEGDVLERAAKSLEQLDPKTGTALAGLEHEARALSTTLLELHRIHSQITGEMTEEGDRLIEQATLVIVALVFTLGALIVLTYVGIRNAIARPLQSLAGTADRVAHHDLAAEFEPWQTGDEVGRLADSLGVMLNTIRERTHSLERKTRELEAFTYSVAHDLKAPLREIEGFSSLMERAVGSGLGEKPSHYLTVIRRSALRMTTLINDLLAYSRLEQQDLPKRRVNLRALMDQVVADRPQRQDGSAARITIAMPAVWVWGEPTMIQQALANLIDNAVKFSRTSAEPTVTVGATTTAVESVLWVQDSGIGFSQSDADKLFQLFRRMHADDEYEGTGIGLAIVKLVMDKHDGRVWAEASPGKGATFFLAFPQRAGADSTAPGSEPTS